LSPKLVAGTGVSLTIQNPGFNETIKIDATGGAPDPSVDSDMTDDFLCGTIGSLLSWISNASGAGAVAVVSNANVDGNHQGIVRFQTGSTAAGRAGLRLATTQSNVGATSTMFVEYLAFVEQLSTAAEEFTFYAGYTDATGAGLFVTNAISFVYDRAISGVNWRAFAQGGIATNTDTGVPVVVGWTKLRIEIGLGGADFFIGGVPVANIPLANLPGVGAFFGLASVIQKSVGTGQTRVSLDYVNLGYTFSPPR
jgi:hypothetical protein